MVSASARWLPVAEELAELFPEGHCQRGWTVLITAAFGQGGHSLAYALASEPSRRGHWCAVVGAEDPGIAAAAELGLDLTRVVFVPLAGEPLAEAAGSLLDGFDMLLLVLDRGIKAATARRLAARARDRRAVIVVVGKDNSVWPEADLTITVKDAHWEGLGQGSGRLRARQARVHSAARRGERRPSAHALHLPSHEGSVGVCDDAKT
ncbi:MAG: hypothetical protein NT160_07030 [Actinobacteria bacterium]|nr:hypothetical protein [Actinomycetota bacterium]